MKCIATYPTYIQANERQMDLLAAELDALVQYVPTGFDQVYFGRDPIYALMVPEEQVDRAIKCIRLIADPDHKCLYRCPECDSDQVKELNLNEGFGTGEVSLAFTAGLIAIVSLFRLRRYGRKYHCIDCGAAYRKKP